MSKIPKLRFKEFSGEWIKIKVGNHLKEYKEKSVEENEYPVLTSSNKGLVLQKEYFGEGRIAERENIGFNILPKEYITYRSRSDNRTFTFNVNTLGLTGIISTYYPVFQFEDGNNIFFTELMKVHQHDIGRYSVGTSQTVLSFNELKKITLNFPSKEEQERIASFLISVDTKIEQFLKKEILLKEYKKGVMQKIFNQEIRFRDDDGSKFSEWKEKNFGEVFKRITTKNKENNLNVLTISAQQGLINQKKYFNKSVSAKDVTGYYLLENGDFSYNKSYSKGYPMGAIKKLNNYDKGVVSTLYICFRINDDNDSIFYEKYFDSCFLNKELHKIAQEGARNHGLLNMSVVEFFSDIKIPVPSREEQNKIANFLSSIDNKIEQTQKQLEETKEFKKALLQQMFV